MNDAPASRESVVAAFKVAITNHESGVHTLTLNNPLINGDPDALLFVTMNRGAEFLRYAYYVVYDNGYWRIRYETDGNGGLYEDYSPPPFYFNVLIVKTK